MSIINIGLIQSDKNKMLGWEYCYSFKLSDFRKCIYVYNNHNFIEFFYDDEQWRSITENEIMFPLFCDTIGNETLF